MAYRIEHCGNLTLPKPEFVLDENRLFARVFGTGIPTVLIHGNHGSGYTFAMILPEIMKEFQVILPDMPGFGSGPPMSEFFENDPLESVAYVEEILKALKISTAILGGHSLGGLISLLTALDRPSIVRALVLIDSFVDYHERPEGLRRFQGSYPFPHNPNIDAEIGDACDDGKSVNWYNWFDVSGRIQEIHIPVLEMMGEANPDTNDLFEKWLIEKRSIVPFNWVTKRILGGAHFIHIEQPEKVLDELLPFLRSINPYKGSMKCQVIH